MALKAWCCRTNYWTLHKTWYMPLKKLLCSARPVLYRAWAASFFTVNIWENSWGFSAMNLTCIFSMSLDLKYVMQRRSKDIQRLLSYIARRCHTRRGSKGVPTISFRILGLRSQGWLWKQEEWGVVSIMLNPTNSCLDVGVFLEREHLASFYSTPRILFSFQLVWKVCISQHHCLFVSNGIYIQITIPLLLEKYTQVFAILPYLLILCCPSSSSFGYEYFWPRNKFKTLKFFLVHWFSAVHLLQALGMNISDGQR